MDKLEGKVEESILSNTILYLFEVIQAYSYITN